MQEQVYQTSIHDVNDLKQRLLVVQPALDKRIIDYFVHRRQSWGLGGRDPHILGRGGRGRVVKYYYILSCTGSMFESGDFWREIE